MSVEESTAPDESLEWLAMLEEWDLPLDTVGRRVAVWQESSGAVTWQTALLQHANVRITDQFSVPNLDGARLGSYRVALYLVRADALTGPQAPPLWQTSALGDPLPVRLLRATARHAASLVAAEVRWRVAGRSTTSIVGLGEATPKRELELAWLGLPLLLEQIAPQGTEALFRDRIRIALTALERKPSALRELTLRRLAESAGYTREHFSSTCAKYGIDKQALLAWRPGMPVPV